MKKLKIKVEIKEKIIFGIVMIGIILLAIILANYLTSDMERHIETISQECAERGYGITSKYTKEGDKYYECKRK